MGEPLNKVSFRRKMDEMDLLEPVVGKNNVKAQVTAEVDFNQTESTVEQHRPNLSPDASAVRSQQIVESGGDKGAQPPTGVPGAVSNQPPQGSTSPAPARRNSPGRVIFSSLIGTTGGALGFSDNDTITLTTGNATVTAASVDNRGGTLHSDGSSTLTVTVDGLLDNYKVWRVA